MKKMLNDLLFIFPTMAYYVLEAIIVGVFISIVWKLFLSRFLFDISYFQIVAIYWIIKMLLFDVFKLIAGFASLGSNMQKEIDKTDSKDYNEGITE